MNDRERVTDTSVVESDRMLTAFTRGKDPQLGTIRPSRQARDRTVVSAPETDPGFQDGQGQSSISPNVSPKRFLVDENRGKVWRARKDSNFQPSDP